MLRLALPELPPPPRPEHQVGTPVRTGQVVGTGMQGGGAVLLSAGESVGREGSRGAEVCEKNSFQTGGTAEMC